MSCSLLGRKELTADVINLAMETGTSDGCPTAAKEAVESKMRDTAKRELLVSLAAPADGRSADTSAVVGTDVAAATAAAVGFKWNSADKAVAPSAN